MITTQPFFTFLPYTVYPERFEFIPTTRSLANDKKGTETFPAIGSKFRLFLTLFKATLLKCVTENACDFIMFLKPPPPCHLNFHNHINI